MKYPSKLTKALVATIMLSTAGIGGNAPTAEAGNNKAAQATSKATPTHKHSEMRKTAAARLWKVRSAKPVYTDEKSVARYTSQRSHELEYGAGVVGPMHRAINANPKIQRANIARMGDDTLRYYIHWVNDNNSSSMWSLLGLAIGLRAFTVEEQLYEDVMAEGNQRGLGLSRSNYRYDERR